MAKNPTQEQARDFAQLSLQAVTSLVQRLALVPDPRGRQGILHLFSDILAILILGTLCGCDDAEALEDWAQKEESWLRSFLPLPNGIPSQDTYLRALASLEPQPFREVFRTWVTEVFGLLGLRGQLALDGKTLRGATRTNSSNSPVHIVSALCCELGFVVGQIRTREKSNEITAMPELLRLLSLQGALVSTDAMGCHVEIAQTIVEGKGDYLFGLKGNQPTLAAEVEELFREAEDERQRTEEEVKPQVERDEQVDAGHGRIETRRASVCHQFEGFVPSAERFPELKTVLRVEAEIEEKTGGKRRREERYYISSRHLSAREANQAVRAHWQVENQLHWCLDVTFGEDGCRTGTKNAGENLAVVRHFALNLVRAYTGDRLSIRRRRRHCDYNLEYRMRVLAASVQ